MSDASVYLADGRRVCAFRDGVDQLFLGAFTRADRVELFGDDALQLLRTTYPPESFASDEELVVLGFRATAGVLRERLDVMGLDSGVMAIEFERLLDDERERLRLRASNHTGSTRAEIASQLASLNELSWTGWVAALRDLYAAGDLLLSARRSLDPASASWLLGLWEAYDERHQLRAVLEALPNSEELTLDLAELAGGDWIPAIVDPRAVAQDFVEYATLGGLAPIILTEGSFDVQVLDVGLQLRRPHLRDYLKLPDFTVRAEGGAAALRQTVRAFAASGIPNRVVALFDNDAAAADVLRAIDRSTLPPNITATQLPTLPLAERYPTIGPQGESIMDVNGRACSIELYLGADVLAGPAGLEPVEWRGYVPAVAAYQGEIARKGQIQDRFRRKAATAFENAAAIEAQDWSGIDLVLEHLMATLRNLSGRLADARRD